MQSPLYKCSDSQGEKKQKCLDSPPLSGVGWQMETTSSIAERLQELLANEQDFFSDNIARCFMAETLADPAVQDQIELKQRLEALSSIYYTLKP